MNNLKETMVAASNYLQKVITPETSLPVTDDEIIDINKLREKVGGNFHVFQLKTFNSPQWCDVCGDFIWGLINQGYYCVVCKGYCVHHRCKDLSPLNCPGPYRDHLTSQEEEAQVEQILAPSESQKEISSEEITRVKMENLMIEKNRLKIKTKLSLGQVEVFGGEINQQIDQVQSLINERKRLIQESAELEYSLLQKKIELIQKKNSHHIKNILTSINNCCNHIQTLSQHLDSFEKSSVTTSVTLGSSPHSSSIKLSSSPPSPFLGSHKLAALGIDQRNFEISTFETIINKLEITLNCKEIPSSYLANVKESKKALEEENSSLERTIRSLKEQEKDILEEEQTTTSILTNLQIFEANVLQLENCLSEGSLFDKNNVSSKVKSALDGINKTRSELKYDLGKSEFELLDAKTTAEHHFVETPEIKFCFFENNKQPQVKAATVTKLIERLTYPRVEDLRFQKAFLTTYRIFLKPSELLEKLILRYCTTPALQSFSISEKILYGINKTQQIPIRLRVLNVIKYWVENFYDLDFSQNELLMNILKDFLENTVNQTGNGRIGRLILQSLFKKQNQKPHSTSVSRVSTFQETLNLLQLVPSNPDQPPPILPEDPFKRANGNFHILDLDPLEIARQLILVEQTLYFDLEFQEFLQQSWQKRDKEKLAPNILKMIRHFNKIGNLVISCVVKEDVPEKRIQILEHFIKVAKHFHELRNFNGLMEILSGLNSSSVARMKKTWAGVDSNLLLQFETLKKLMEKNYKILREEYLSSEPPCIPFIGIFLTDLTFIEEGNPTTINNLINFQKFRLIYEVIDNIKRFQGNERYNFQHVQVICKWLLEHEEIDQDDAYRKSLNIESKDSQRSFLEEEKKN